MLPGRLELLTLKEQLIVLTECKGHNQWLTNNIMDVYVRLGKRLLPTKQVGEPVRYGLESVRCLDIANIIVDPEYQHKGYFKAFLEDAEDVCKDVGVQVIYVENVINKFLARYLRRQNYRLFTDNGEPSYFKAL